MCAHCGRERRWSVVQHRSASSQPAAADCRLGRPAALQAVDWAAGLLSTVSGEEQLGDCRPA